MGACLSSFLRISSKCHGAAGSFEPCCQWVKLAVHMPARLFMLTVQKYVYPSCFLGLTAEMWYGILVLGMVYLLCACRFDCAL